MIKSFKNKKLEEFYKNGSVEDFNEIDENRLRLILSQLDAAEEIKDCKIPSFNFKKSKRAGMYSISVGNGKRLIFRLIPRTKN